MHSDTKKISLPQQLIYQVLLLFIAFTVLYPVFWVIGMSFNGKDEARPKDIIPTVFSVEAYQRVLDQPTNNPVSFVELVRNSLLLAVSTAGLSVLIGVSAAYIFSRFDFSGRKMLMMIVITVLMLPSIATIAPLFVLLNGIQIPLTPWFKEACKAGGFVGTAMQIVNACEKTWNLRNSLPGVGMAMLSGMLPFAIWNLKGYLDTIPKDLSEAAFIDGASFNQVFLRIILPLSMPALAVTFFMGFLGGWTEFALSWQFLTNPKNFTLAMSLYNMTGQFSGDTPWSAFAAMSLMIATPVAIIYLFLQRYIVGGLTVGSVK